MAQGDMPYEIKKEGDQWCVYEKSSGKKIEDFPNRMAAMNKVRALMKSPPKNEKETAAEAKAADEEAE